MRRGRKNNLQYFNVAFACEKGNGIAQNMRHMKMQSKRTMEQRKKHNSSEKKPKGTDYNGHR